MEGRLGGPYEAWCGTAVATGFPTVGCSDLEGMRRHGHGQRIDHGPCLRCSYHCALTGWTRDARVDRGGASASWVEEA
jgi:hypothetical protein